MDEELDGVEQAKCDIACALNRLQMLQQRESSRLIALAITKLEEAEMWLLRGQ
jgi:hypothetical protein